MLETTKEERAGWLEASYLLLSEEPSVELMAEAWSRIGALCRDVDRLVEALEDLVLEVSCCIGPTKDNKRMHLRGCLTAEARAVLEPKEAT